MNKKEFIQQFVIHASGPMFTLTNYRGERIFNEGKIIDIAKSFAEEVCDDSLDRNYISLDEIIKELTELRLSIKNVLYEHEFGNNWKKIYREISNAEFCINHICELLHIELPE